jgi:hypothetical protein
VSWSWTGPSTIHFSTSGISSDMREAVTATTADSAIRPRIGRTYGHSRSSERIADRERTAGAGSVVVAGITT